MIDVRDNGKSVGDEKFASPRWDISQERAFIENIVNQRTNIMLVFFAIIVAGSINSRDIHLMQLLILTFGVISITMISLAIFRAQKKLDILIGLLNEDSMHPVFVTNQIAGPGSRRKLIGYGLPILCISTLIILLVASVFGFLSAPK